MFDLLTAASLNGVIAPAPGAASSLLLPHFATPEILAWKHATRRRYDAVAVGAGTVLTNDPSLTSHAAPGGAAGVVRVTLDAAGRIPAGARFFDGSARTLVGVAASTPPAYRELLAARGVEAVACGEERVDLAAFAAALAERGLRRVVVEGGGGLNRALLRRGLVDLIQVMVIPAVLDARATNLFDGEDPPVALTLVDCERCGDFVVLRYRPRALPAAAAPAPPGGSALS